MGYLYYVCLGEPFKHFRVQCSTFQIPQAQTPFHPPSPTMNAKPRDWTRYSKKETKKDQKILYNLVKGNRSAGATSMSTPSALTSYFSGSTVISGV